MNMVAAKSVRALLPGVFRHQQDITSLLTNTKTETRDGWKCNYCAIAKSQNLKCQHLQYQHQQYN